MIKSLYPTTTNSPVLFYLGGKIGSGGGQNPINISLYARNIQNRASRAFLLYKILFLHPLTRFLATPLLVGVLSMSIVFYLNVALSTCS